MQFNMSGFDTSTSKMAFVATLVIVVVAAFGVGLLTGQDESIALYAVLGIGIFIFAFLNMDFALSVLILSMLLSPEFGNNTAHGADRGVVIRIDDLILGLITASTMMRVAIYKDLGMFIRTPLNRPIFIYLGLSLLATFIGIFNGDVRPLVGILYNVKYLQYFLIFLMVASHVKDLKTLNRYLFVMIFTAIAVSLYAIAQIPSGVRVSAPFEGEAGEANTLGGYLVIMMMMVFGILTGTKTAGKQSRLALLLVLMGVPFLYTLSRSSWISILPGIIIFTILSEKRKNIIVAVLILLVTVPFLLPSAVYERFEYTFSMDNTLRTDVVELGDTALDPSTSARIISWSSTIEQWMEKPVFGWGVTGAGFKDAQYFRVLAETGMAGFVAFMLLMVAIHKMGYGILKQINEKKYPIYYGIVVGYIAGFWGLLVHAIGANTFIIVRIMEPFWFFTGLIILLPDLLKQEEEKKKLLGDDTPLKELSAS